VQIPTPADASFGTALIAGTGAGIFPDSASAVRQCLHLDGSLVPDPECAGFYQELFKTYTGIHDALAPVYAKR